MHVRRPSSASNGHLLFVECITETLGKASIRLVFLYNSPQSFSRDVTKARAAIGHAAGPWP